MQIPSADFVANATTICPGTQIEFTDLSTSNTTTWSWIFPGGTPAVSSLASPLVTYNTAGIYAVTLVATNANGNDVEIKSGYINVTPVNALPLAEGFATFYPLNWTEYDDHNDNVVWMHNTAVGGYGASSESAYFDNYNHDSGGARDALRTPRYDLTNAVNPVLTFDLAYALWSIAYNDSLAVLVSTDCDTSYTTVYVKNAAALATAPNFSSAVFVPDSSQWRTDTISLLPYVGYGRVTVSFENIGHYGQALYIDNVNIHDVPLSVAMPVQSEFITVYPNPTSGRFTIHVPPGSQRFLQIMNSLGEIILTDDLAAGGSQTAEYDLSGYGKGLYMLNVVDERGRVTTKKVVVE
jgi:PKD repeat protein